MQRPIGVTLLAIGAGLAGVYQIWKVLVFAGIVDFTIMGRQITFDEIQWGYVFWYAILAAIWFWVAAGFWNVRAYAYSFGSFIALFTLIWGFFEILFSDTSIEYNTVPWFLALAIYMYLNYPGVREHFYESEMSRLSPEQRAAMENLQAANMAASAAMAAPQVAPAPAAMSAPPPPAAVPPAAAPPAAAPPAAAPPADEPPTTT
jgi:hypothetical protein